MPVAAQKTPVNLTQTAHFLRNFIKYGGLFLLFLMVGRIFLTSFTAYWKATHPEPPPPPTMGFGLLTAIEFPENELTPSSYRLETINGTTPFISDRAKVFRMSPARASLLAVDRAKKSAANMGYVFEPEVISERTYRWTFSNPILSTLEMDIITGQFEIKTNWASYPDLLVKTQPLNATTAINKVKTVVQQAGMFSPDLASGPVVTTYIKAIGGQFTPAASLSDADFIQVDIYRQLIDEKYSSVTSDANQGVIHAIVSSSGAILEMKMTAYPVDFTVAETYPLRSSQEAFQVLSNGQGYIAEKGLQDEAVIRDITLAYYEPDEQHSYYLPVYVFRGDGGFVGYVSALHPQIFEQQPLTQ